MVYPQYVQVEIARRQHAAEEAYAVVKPACDNLGMTRDQYIASYLANLPALTWTTSGSTAVWL